MATLEERKQEYLIHESAGVDYYNGFRSQLTLDIENGNKSLIEAVKIHKKMKVVGEYLRSGDWKSAYDDLTRLTEDYYCKKELIDLVKSDVLNYITNNYSW